MSSAGPREYAGINDEIPTIQSSHELISSLPRHRIIGSNADTYTSIDYATLELFFPQISGIADIEVDELAVPLYMTVDKTINGAHDISVDHSSILHRRRPAEINCIECRTGLRTDSLCSRVISINEKAVSDEDLLTLLLSDLRSTVNSRKIAMRLILQFETIGAVMAARSEQLLQVPEVEPETIAFLKAIGAAGARLAREEISHRSVLDAWDKLISYLRTTMAHQTVEQFRVLFLDRRNVLISDEVQHQGTIDHTPVYPREVVKRALELDSSAIIMVHNHPSNHPAPSKADIEMTRQVREIVEKLGIVLHDHVIVSRRGHTSFRQMGLL
jgi:DNA repair protein RadC